MIKVIKPLDDKNLVLSKNNFGGKASNLNYMHRLNFPVPNGFVLSTGFCTHSGIDFSAGEGYAPNSALMTMMYSHIRYLSLKTGKVWNPSFDDEPLLVSVRSGAPISMPGMMDTILNVGLTRENLDAFIKSKNVDRSFGLDCYRRLIQMYGTTVKDIPAQKFTEVYDAIMLYWEGLDEIAYEKMVEKFEEVYQEHTGETFPDDPNKQLLEACNAVFRSWYSPKAKAYRAIENIPESMGTAVTVQEMIFGNLNDKSATGVVFTHNPNNGVNSWYGDFLPMAQGEDVVAGTHKVKPISEILEDKSLAPAAKDLQNLMRSLYLREREILDIEFTIEDGKLYLLQWRVAKASTKAKIRHILDMTRDGVITTGTAADRIIKYMPSKAVVNNTDGNALKLLGSGLGAVPGLVTAKIAIGHQQADIYAANNEPYIYIAKETAPDDIKQMKNAVGILTSTGGAVSHAVVVARAWDKCCVVGFEKIKFNDGDESCFLLDGVEYHNGNLIKINGDTGEVWA